MDLAVKKVLTLNHGPKRGVRCADWKQQKLSLLELEGSIMRNSNDLWLYVCLTNTFIKCN